MYGKVFASMYDGTLYGHWQAIVTFQQMIVLCDSDGVVDMTPQAMAARTSIPLEILQEGLKILGQPDPYTRTPGEDGKRITLLDEHRPWGWKIVNHARYKYLVDVETVKAQNRERQRRFRDKQDSNAASRHVTHVTPGNAPSLHADADADADADAVGVRRRATRSTATHLPANFTLTEVRRLYAEEQKVEAVREFEAFSDYWRAASGAAARKRDWDAAWRGWCRRAADFKPTPGRGRSNSAADRLTWVPTE